MKRSTFSVGFAKTAKGLRSPIRQARVWGGAVKQHVRRKYYSSRRAELQAEALRALDADQTPAGRLSDEELIRFQRDGYLFPFTLCSPETMRTVREYVRDVAMLFDCPVPGYPRSKWRHIDDAVVYRLCSHPAALDRVQQLLGPNVVLWQSNLFNKPPGSAEIPWHQDRLFLELDGGRNVSVWLALDDVNTDNSCVEIIPGSHLAIVPPAQVEEKASSQETAFGRMADPQRIDATQAVPICLKPGQFMLFDEFLLHRSAANRSHRQRCGLAIRYTGTETKITHQIDGYHALLLCGEDKHGLNRLGLPPVCLPFSGAPSSTHDTTGRMSPTHR